MIFNKNKSQRKSLKTLLLSLLMFIGIAALFPIQVSAHKAYTTVFTYDETYWTGTVVSDNVGMTGTKNDHLEPKQWGGIYDVGKSYNSMADLVKKQVFTDISEGTEDKDSKAIGDEIFTKEGGKTSLVPAKAKASEKNLYSFPYRHGIFGNKVDASEKDRTRANYISDGVTRNLNDATNKVIAESGAQSNSNTFYTVSRQLSQLGDNFGSTTITVPGGKNQVTVTQGAGDKKISKKKNEFDYQYMQIGNSTYRFLFTKGYTDEVKGNKVSDKLGEKKMKEPNEDAEVIGFAHVFVQGMLNKYVHEIDGMNASKFNNVGRIEQTIINLLNDFLQGIISMLGLESIDTLVFNLEDRKDSEMFFYGIAPLGQFTGFGGTLFLLSTFIAIIYVMFLVVIKLNEWQISTVTGNSAKRFDASQTLVDVLGVFVILGGFTILFQLLSRFNFLLVNLLYAYFGTGMFETLMQSAGTLAGILIAFAYLGITLYMNIVYGLRSFALTILFGLSPLAIVTKLNSSGKRNVFGAYVNTVLGTLFMQTFHAIILSGILAINQSGTTNLMKLILLYAFIPMTSMLSKEIFQFGGDTVGKTASAGAQTAGFMATTAAIGTVAGFSKAGASLGNKDSGSLSERSSGSSGGFGGDDGGGGPGGGGTPSGIDQNKGQGGDGGSNMSSNGAEKSNKPGSTGFKGAMSNMANKASNKINDNKAVQGLKNSSVGVGVGNAGKKASAGLNKLASTKPGQAIGKGIGSAWQNKGAIAKQLATSAAMMGMAYGEATYGGQGGAGQLGRAIQERKRDQQLMDKLDRQNQYTQELGSEMENQHGLTTPGGGNELQLTDGGAESKDFSVSNQQALQEAGIESLQELDNGNVQMVLDTQFDESGSRLEASPNVSEENQKYVSDVANTVMSADMQDPSQVKSFQDSGLVSHSVNDKGQLVMEFEKSSVNIGGISNHNSHSNITSTNGRDPLGNIKSQLGGLGGAERKVI